MKDKVNLNLWFSLTEQEYATLMNAYGDEGSFKFDLSREVRSFIKRKSESLQSENISTDDSQEIA